MTQATINVAKPDRNSPKRLIFLYMLNCVFPVVIIADTYYVPTVKEIIRNLIYLSNNIIFF